MDFQKAIQVKNLVKEAYLVRPRNLVFAFGVDEDQVNDLVADHRAIVGVGTIKKGKDDYAIRVFTEMPEPVFNRNQLADQIGVPVDDLDIVVTGGIVAFNSPIRTQMRPATIGCSISPASRGGTGTLGGFVKDGNNHLYILSNNHVLADCNRVAIGDEIIQPGNADPCHPPASAIAFLSRFVPLNLSGQNFVDAAIARLNDSNGHSNIMPNSVPTIGQVQGMTAPQVGMVVAKYGRTTGFTVGTIKSLSFDVTVGIAGTTANFDDQLYIEGNGGAFSQGGDSGALIVDVASKRAVGLLFAGDPATGNTFANPISNVLSQLGVTLA